MQRVTGEVWGLISDNHPYEKEIIKPDRGAGRGDSGPVSGQDWENCLVLYYKS